MVFRGPKLIVGSKEIVETPRSYRKVAAWSLCSICKITQIPAATPSWPQLNNVAALQSVIISDKAAHPHSLARIFAICTHTHNKYTMIKSQTFFLTCSPTMLPCMLVGTIQYNAIKYQKTCAAPLQGGPEKVILFEFFLIFLSRTEKILFWFLATLCSWAGWFEVYQVKIPEFWFLATLYNWSGPGIAMPP